MTRHEPDLHVQDAVQASPVLRGPEALDAAPFQSLWGQNQPRAAGGRRDIASQQVGSEASRIEPNRPEQDPRISALEAEIARLKEQNLRQQQEHQKKLQDAILASRTEALAQVQRDDAARTQALARAAQEALAQQAQYLQRLESEAVRIAAAALQPVFGETVELADLVKAMIAHQVQLLQERSVVELRVSAADGLDLEALIEALHAYAQSEAAVVADPALPAGVVRIGMRLGHIRLDLKDYGLAVRQALQEIADAHVSGSDKEGGRS